MPRPNRRELKRLQAQELDEEGYEQCDICKEPFSSQTGGLRNHRRSCAEKRDQRLIEERRRKQLESLVQDFNGKFDCSVQAVPTLG